MLSHFAMAGGGDAGDLNESWLIRQTAAWDALGKAIDIGNGCAYFSIGASRTQLSSARRAERGVGI